MKNADDIVHQLLFGVVFFIAATCVQAGEPRVGDDIVFRYQDIRLVNGKKVDLGPVHRWYTTKQGERPLKHWKRLNVYQIKSRVANQDFCVIKNEAGEFKEIYVYHLPASIRKFVGDIVSCRQQIAQLESEIALDSKRARVLDAVTPTSYLGPIEDVEMLAARRARANLAAAHVVTNKERLAKLQATYDQLQEVSESGSAIFCMFTGTIKSGIEVWECGLETH